MTGKFTKRACSLALCLLMIIGCAQYSLAAFGEEDLCTGGTAHRYRVYETPEEATCTEEGVVVYMCDGCGKTYEDVTPALGHDYQFIGWELGHEPVCTAAYDYTFADYRCGRCSEFKSIPYRRGDDWHAWTAGYVKAPTVNEDGYTVYTCSACGQTKHADIVAKLGTTYPLPFHGFAYNETDYNVSAVGSNNFTFQTFSEATKITVPFAATVGAYLGGTPKYSYLDGEHITAAFLRGENLDIIADDYRKFKPFCDIVIEGAQDNWPFSVYLEDFGTTVYTTEQRYNPDTDRIEDCQVPHATKGIRSITVNGNNVSVYLVNSNLGFLDYNSQENPDYVYTKKQAGITVNGWGSGVYMGDESNYGQPGLVHCDITLTSQASADYEYYDTYCGENFGRMLYSGSINKPVSDFYGTARVCHLTVDSLRSSGAEDGVLNGYADAELVNCVYKPAHGVTLNDHASLTVKNGSFAEYGEYEVYDEEYDYTYTDYGIHDEIPVTLNDRASLAVDNSTMYGVTANGIHTLRMNNAKFLGPILASGSVTTVVDSSEAPVESGVRLTLKLGDGNTVATPYRYEGQSPEIMVDNNARLIIRDDEEIPGVGELTVGNGNDDGGHYFCAAIGGTPALEPLPHGRVAIVSGVVTARAFSGGAAIGGSAFDPDIRYEVLQEGYYPAYEGQAENVVRVYVSPSVGNLYYDTKDDRYNPYAGGWWLNKSGDEYYPVDESGNMIYIPDVYSDEVDKVNSTPGFCRDGGSVVISGGVVNVTAASGGAAIGGAYGGNGGVIQIAGGTVNARSSGLSAAIGGGAVNWGAPERRAIAFLEAPANGDWDSVNFAITPRLWIDSYTYDPSMGGGSGSILVTGAAVVNAVSDNPAYDEFGAALNKPQQYYTSQNGYDTVNDYNCDEYSFWYGPGNDHPQMTWEEVKNTFTNGKLTGYVIGSATELANRYYENTTEILKIGGLDGNPLLILRQAEQTAYYTDVDVSLDNFYREMNPPDHPFTGDALGREVPGTNGDNTFEPSRITGACVILKIGKEQEGYAIEPVVIENYAYRLRGQIVLPDIDYMFTIPTGTSFTLLDGTAMTVGEGFRIIAGESDQFTVEAGASVKGKGTWPGKATVDPKNAPNTEQIKSLLALLDDAQVDEETGESTVVSHLCVAQTSNGCVIIGGNGAETVKAKASAMSLPVLTVLSAGHYGFKKSDVEGVEAWSLNSSDENTVVSLVENGALTASPGSHTTSSHAFDVEVEEVNGIVTVTLTSPILASPKYVVFEGEPDEVLSFTFAPNRYSSELAFELTLTGEQVVDNKAIFSIPSFAGSEFRLQRISPLKDKCALRYGGTFGFTTPVANFAGITVNQLQLKYGDKTTLDGIDGEGFVAVPSIAGFPVTGDASLTLNTFNGQRKLYMSVNLETPIFEGAFSVKFKEARGIVMLDSIYAELAVGEGGIPLVPPTVIGYLQGGGLGISGLADTVNMDSFGAPSVRLEVAAKGSILDVMDGWVRLSVGLDGFDLRMTDISIADLKFIKEVGMSAKWDAGEKTIKGKTYWGISTDMSQYIVVAIPVPYVDYYGDDASLPLLLSATGSVEFGGFTGYYIENGWAYFIYQLHASGNLNGKLTIPKKLVAGTFPFSSVELANAQIGFYAAASAATKVDASQVKGSPASALRQLASNVSIDFDAAIGTKLVVGTGAFKFYLRAVYVLGDKGLDLGAGYGSGGELDLSGYVNHGRIKGKKYAMIGEIVDEETGKSIPTVLEAGLDSLANLDMAGGTDAQSGKITLTRLRAVNGFTADVDAAAVGNTFLAIRLTDENAVLTANDLTVTCGGQSVALIPAQFDENGNQLNTANFFADEGVVYFAPEAAGSYTVSSAAPIESVEAIETTVFASLDAQNTTLGADGASYAITDTDGARTYKAQLVLGKTEGAGDCLLSESDLLTGETAYSGTLPYTLTGSALPTGEYYPSVLLLEHIEAEGENGESVETWTVIDQKSFAQTVHYTNDTIPEGPAAVTLAYSGNATMTAGWDAVTGADAYQIAIYDGNGADTGLLFRTAGDQTALVMDLSPLDEDQAYTAGVKAIFYADGEDGTYQLSYETRSNGATLVKADPPEISYSANVVRSERGRYALAVGENGGKFTVTSPAALDFTVSGPDGAVVASAAGETRLTVQIPASGGQRSYTLLAKDPQTGEYVLDSLDVSVDGVAPMLVLDDLGVFPKHGTDFENTVYVKGHSEAGASVYIWKDGEVYTSGAVSANGSFLVPVNYTGEPDFTVQTMDAAGNLSAPLAVSTPADPVIVTFDAGEAECTTASVEIARGGTIDFLPAAYAAGKRLEGWYTSPENGTRVDRETAFTENVTLYARWTPAVTVRFDLNGERALCRISEMTVAEGAAAGDLPVPTPLNDGRMFLGWYTALTGGTAVTEETVFTEDTTVHARFCDYVTVTFEAGLGACEVDALKVPAGSAIDAYPVPTAFGYTFGGWYDGEEAVGASTLYGESRTLTAAWTRNTASLAVTQADCENGEELSDPVFTQPEGTLGVPTVTYVGINGTSYFGSAKPTAEGFYKVVVVCDTFEQAYVGSAEFTVGHPTVSHDLNGDRIVNIADVTTLLGALAGSGIPALFDLNGDGEVNISDVTALLGVLAQN